MMDARAFEPWGFAPALPAAALEGEAFTFANELAVGARSLDERPTVEGAGTAIGAADSVTLGFATVLGITVVCFLGRVLPNIGSEANF